MLYNIYPNLTCLVPNKPLNNLNFGYILSIYNDKISESSKKKMEQIKKSNKTFNPGLSSEELEICYLNNNNFKLYLHTVDGNIKNFYYKMNNSNVQVPIEIRSDQLNNNARYYILVDYINFINLVKTTVIFQDGEIFGNYSLSITKNNIVPILQDNTNEDYTYSKEVGELLSYGKFTNNWIPGHLYLLKDKKKVLYLGNIKDVMSFYYPWSKDRNHVSYLFSNICSNENTTDCHKIITEETMLLMEDSLYDFCYTSTRVDFSSLKDKDIKNIIFDRVQEYSINNSILRTFLLVDKKYYSGIDLGQLITLSNNDITSEFKSSIEYYLNNNSSNSNFDKIKYYLYSSILEYVLSNQELKKEIIDIKINRFKNTELPSYSRLISNYPGYSPIKSYDMILKDANHFKSINLLLRIGIPEKELIDIISKEIKIDNNNG